MLIDNVNVPLPKMSINLSNLDLGLLWESITLAWLSVDMKSGFEGLQFRLDKISLRLLILLSHVKGRSMFLVFLPFLLFLRQVD